MNYLNRRRYDYANSQNFLNKERLVYADTVALVSGRIRSRRRYSAVQAVGEVYRASLGTFEPFTIEGASLGNSGQYGIDEDGECITE